MKNRSVLLRKIAKSFYLLPKSLIYVVSFISHRLYMKIYGPFLKLLGMKICGKVRYIGRDVKFDDYSMVKLGDRTVISNDVYFLTHDYSITTALIHAGVEVKKDIASIGKIVVGNNVFIGKGSIILPNTTIGTNVIIGAGTVVRGVVPNNTVVIGNPGRVICTIDQFLSKYEKNIDSDGFRID